MWKVEFEPDRKRLSLRLAELVNPKDVRDMAVALRNALASTAGHPFRVLLDLRGMMPLEQESIQLLAEAKRACLDSPGCRGLVVLADSATVAMQQHNSRIRSGTGEDREQITREPDQARKLLAAAT